MRTLIVWHNLNKDTYYYKFINSTYKRYTVGDFNSYNHKVILVIQNNEIQPVKNYVSLKKMLLSPILFIFKKITDFLEKINN